MNRHELAWIVIRALGLISLWLFAIAVLGLLLFLFNLFFGLHVNSGNPNPRPDFMLDYIRYGANVGTEFVTYGFLAFYFLRKGEAAHRLLLKRIPDA
jgi:hypothetical protein